MSKPDTQTPADSPQRPPPDNHSDTPDDGLGEPLSLAEEIAHEIDDNVDAPDRYKDLKQSEVHIARLQQMSMNELIKEARA